MTSPRDPQPALYACLTTVIRWKSVPRETYDHASHDAMSRFPQPGVTTMPATFRTVSSACLTLALLHIAATQTIALPQPTQNAAPKTAEEFNQRGEERYESGEFDDALADFNQALKLDPKLAVAVSNRAWVFFEQDDLPTALSGFDDALLLDRTLTRAHEGRASVLMEQGKLEEAISSFSKAIVNCSDKDQAAGYYNDRAICFHQKGDNEEALADLDRALKKSPDYALAHSNKGDILRILGRYKESIAALRKAIKLDKQDPEFYYLLGQTYDAQKEFEASVDAYAAAIARDDENSAYYRGRATANQRLGRTTAAVKDLERAIELDPEDSVAVNTLGTIHYGNQELQLARTKFTQAIAIDDQNASFWYNRGTVQLQLGNGQDAINDFSQSLKLRNDPDAYAKRGNAYASLGDHAAATRDFQQAMQLAPNTFHLHHVKYLRVTNATDEPLQVLVQYAKPNAAGKPEWQPSETDALVFKFNSKQSSLLLAGGEQISGARYRIWAQGQRSKKAYLTWQKKDFVVVGESGDLRQSETPGVAEFSFTPKDASAPSSIPTTPQNSVYPRRSVVSSLTYRDTPQGAKGNCTKVLITVDKNPARSLKVGIFEEGADSLGSMWRAGAWVATVLAADITGHDPLSTQVLFEGQGRVDGPSAGGILTVGVLAALNGHEVRPDSAMTGTINPDGTIGPVGGIPHKMEGAAEAGRKLVVIPAGLQRGLDVNKKKVVDLISHGRSLGLEVKPAGDVFAAYEILTGKKLPRPAAGPLPTLDATMQSRVRAKTTKWLRRYQDFVDSYQKTPAQYHTDAAAEMLKEAKTTANRAAAMLQQGHVEIAFLDAVDATRMAAVGAEVDRTIWVDAQRGRETAIRYAKTLGGVKKAKDTAIEALEAYKPQTLSSAGVLLNGYTTLVEAVALQSAGEALLAGEFSFPIGNTKEEREGAALLMAAAYVQAAALGYENIADVLEIAGQVKGRAMPAKAPLIETAIFYRRAAEANLQQFEQAVVNVRAEEEDTEFDVMKRKMMQEDQGYLVTRFALDEAIPKLVRRLSGDASAYALLGGAIHTYVMSARLTAEHYSLGIRRDDSGTATGLRHEPSLNYMLDFTADQSRRSIQLLRKNNVDPMVSVFFTQAATQLRKRTLSDRLSALTVLWQANIQARTLTYLGNFSRNAPTR